MLLRIGHRGAAGHAPENTCASIAKAIALGVDFVEVDVQLTGDGELVIMHDKRLDRTTNGSGYVSNVTLNQIRELDAGGRERVPTLGEVLTLAQHQVGVVLEIISPGIGGQVCAYVREYGFAGPVIYASFLHAELLEVRSTEPRAQTLALLEGIPVFPTRFATEAKATHVGIALDSTTAPYVRALQDRGLQVFVYTVNDPVDIQMVKELRVDGVISDHPERI